MSGREKYLDKYKKILDVLKDLEIKVFEETVDVTREYVYDEISDEEKKAKLLKELETLV